MLVHLEEAALVLLHAAALAEQALRERPAADRDDEPVDDQGLRPLRIRITDVHAVGAHFGVRDLGAEANVEAQLLEVTRRFLCDRAVRHGEQRIERFQHDRLRAEPAPDAAELEADDARADDAKPLRRLREVERAPGVDDALAVESDAT